MNRCIRCGVVLPEVGGRYACPEWEARACGTRALRKNSGGAAAPTMPIDWQATCADYVNRLQLLASDPALQRLADHGTGDDAAALRKLFALLREGPNRSLQPKRRK